MSPVHADDRQKVIAFSAFRNDLVDREMAIRALSAFEQGDAPSVSQYLIENAAIDPERLAAVERIADGLIRDQAGSAHRASARSPNSPGFSDPGAQRTESIGDSASTLVAERFGTSWNAFLQDSNQASSDIRRSRTDSGETPVEPGSGVGRDSEKSPADGDTRNPGAKPSQVDFAPTPDPVPGDRLGRFRIVRKLETGGQGIVFEATDDTELNRRVALKITREESHHKPDKIREARARLAHEGRINALLEHPNIIPVYGLGATPEGRPYYAMRFLDQIDLQAAIRNFHAGLPLMLDPRISSLLTDPSLRQQNDGQNRIEIIASPIRPDRADNARTLPVRPDAVTRERADSASGNSGASDAPSQPGEGIRLDKLEGERNLAFRNLLERFTDICEAIQYAHSKHVLHRDLKPVNVMLGEHGETLVIDWGLARSFDEIDNRPNPPDGQAPDRDDALKVDDDFRLSEQGEFKGTLGYAPPEQLAGDLKSLDERTDVYSLGVILFEILTGRQPFPREELRFIERRHWRSTMLAWATAETPDPSRVNPSVPRGLAAICRKALEPEQRNRYASAAELAEEVENWLADEPVRACPDKPRERLARWTRKNRGKSAAIVATVSLVSLASGAGLVMQSQYTRAILDERDRAKISERRAQHNEGLANEREKDVLRQKAEADRQREVALENQETSDYTTQFMVDLFRAADPIGLDGVVFRNDRNQSEMTVRDVLTRGSQKIRTEFRDRPRTRARISKAIGESFREMSEFELAESHLKENLSIVQASAIPDPVQLSDANLQLARLYHHWAKYDLAEPLYVNAAELIENVQGENVEAFKAKILFFTGWYFADQIDTLKAESYFVRAMKIYDEMPEKLAREPRIQRDRLIVKFGLAACKLDSSRYLAALRELFTILNQIDRFSKEKNFAAVEHFQYGVVQLGLGFNGTAENRFRTALEICDETLGLDHPYVAFIYFHLAEAQERQKKFDESEASYQRCYELTRKSVSLSHPRVVYLVRQYGLLLEKRGKPGRALEIFDEVTNDRIAAFGPDNFRVADALAAKAFHYFDVDDDANGDRYLRQAVEIYDKQPGKWSFILNLIYLRYGNRAARRGDYEQALVYLDKALKLTRERNHPSKIREFEIDRMWALNDYAYSLACVPGHDRKTYSKALAMAGEAVRYDPKNGDFANTLGISLYRTGSYAEAAEVLSKSLEINRSENGGEERPYDQVFLAMAQWRLGQITEAETMFDRFLKSMTRPENARRPRYRRFLREATNLFRPITLPENPFQP